jgi:heme-degrading monooxygenase HmoA
MESEVRPAIARMWEGRVPRQKGDAYLELMEHVALPDYRAVPGNLGAYALRRDEGTTTLVTMLTFWDSVDAIRGFAGEPVERAKYYDFDSEYLLDFPASASHYTVYSGGTDGQR